MSLYATTASYADALCSKISLVTISAVSDCSESMALTSYKNCTRNRGNHYIISDCITATSSPNAFRQISPGNEFASIGIYNTSQCVYPQSGAPKVYANLNQCVRSQDDDTWTKSTIRGNQVRVDNYNGIGCERSITRSQTISIDTCVEVTFEYYTQLTVYSANSGSKSGITWVLIAVLLGRIIVG